MQKMITLQLKAHSRLPIYLNVQTFQEGSGVHIPDINTDWNLPYGKFTLHFKIEKIEPRDGCIAIYSSSSERVRLTLNSTGEEVSEIWVPLQNDEILVLPNRQ